MKKESLFSNQFQVALIISNRRKYLGSRIFQYSFCKELQNTWLLNNTKGKHTNSIPISLL